MFLLKCLKICEEKIMTRYKYIFVFFLISACSSPVHHEDPLRNTKKLIKEGHLSLYKNGAFTVPMTTLTLIPPGLPLMKLLKI